MKKLLSVLSAMAISFGAYAEDKPEPLIDRGMIFDFIHICAVLLIIYLVSSFILQLIRKNFEFRLKSRIVERQTGEEVVSQLIQPEKSNPLDTVLQWLCTLIGIGIGFAVMYLTQPLGLHSLAIMSFSVAVGLGLYYYFAKRNKH